MVWMGVIVGRHKFKNTMDQSIDVIDRRARMLTIHPHPTDLSAGSRTAGPSRTATGRWPSPRAARSCAAGRRPPCPTAPSTAVSPVEWILVAAIDGVELDH